MVVCILQWWILVLVMVILLYGTGNGRGNTHGGMYPTVVDTGTGNGNFAVRYWYW